ncbi:MAG: hypothetical protein DMF63_06445 [Acidobacteria bacterium]|nr:MAG: hypothetical protein DMF63_06445 [Acidobacteriota bacterium]
MAYDPIRRSQLITPHGVGSMLVVKGGVSVMACGLDYWFERENQDSTGIDIGEFEVKEYRLEQILSVSHFRLPPDYRGYSHGSNVPNAGIAIPFVRFPQWHICSSCGRLERLRLIDRDLKLKCRECKERGKTGYLRQAMFVAMCENGHIQDFPWREWAHGSVTPACDRPLRYVSPGGAGLAAQRVRCDCTAERSLGGITTANPDGTTTLSQRLAKDETYFCRGHRPWLGEVQEGTCTAHLRGGMRGASNVWFGRVYSSIYLPQKSNNAPADLIELLRTPRIANTVSVLSGALSGPITSTLRQMYRLEFSTFSDAQLEAALNLLHGIGQRSDQPQNTTAGDDDTTAFRRVEFNALLEDSKDDPLIIDSAQISEYDAQTSRYFSRIGLVNKLRETRVFAGFSRIVADRETPLEERKQMLWRSVPSHDQSWLPASVVHGEGVFLQLNESRLVEWESGNRQGLSKHLKTLVANFETVRQVRGLRPKAVTARFVLLHTLAHLLINRLTFECGYSSASLRERLYVSESSSNPMAGVLIYTAAGDSEGTMGGLVRMGKPKYFEPMFRRALEAAEWCSSDPVCRELGSSSGQGPDSCNLAACHSCALLPETSCEEFNRFLDRSLVVNGPDGDGFAFFDLPQT